MSYAELKTVGVDGVVVGDTEFRNSHGYAARIWTDLFDRYAKDPTVEYDSWINAEGDRLWRLVDDERLEDFERRVLRTTFDNAMVKRQDFQAIANELRAFVAKYPFDNRVCHLEPVARRLEGLKDDESVQAACWRQTSVSDDPWHGQFGPDEYCETCGHLLEKYHQPYDINKGDKHWFVDFSKPGG